MGVFSFRYSPVLGNCCNRSFTAHGVPIIASLLSGVLEFSTIPWNRDIMRSSWAGDSEFSSSCKSSANMARVTRDPSTDLLPNPNFVRVGEVRAASITFHSSSARDMSTTLYPAWALHSPPACPGLDFGSIGGNHNLHA